MVRSDVPETYKNESVWYFECSYTVKNLRTNEKATKRNLTGTQQISMITNQRSWELPSRPLAQRPVEQAQLSPEFEPEEAQ